MVGSGGLNWNLEGRETAGKESVGGGNPWWTTQNTLTADGYSRFPFGNDVFAFKAL